MKIYTDFEPGIVPELKTHNKKQVYNAPCVLDIETSSYYNDNGEKRAVMYIWQMSIFGECYYGRTYDDLLGFLSILKKTYSPNGEILLCYVHNLAYDSHFILPWLNVTKIFATDIHEPLYFVHDDFLEFRCSLRLSGKKLADLSSGFANSDIHKQEGFNYSLLRTYKTELSDTELKYCEYDLLVVDQYIKDEISKNDNDITKIPYTKTSYARRLLRKSCKKDEYIHNFFQYATPTDPEIYLALKAALQGGITHSNQLYANQTLYNITNFDLQSDYPSQTVKNLFPCTPFKSCNVTTFPDDDTTALIAVVKIYGLKSKYYHSILSFSKTNVFCPMDNRRIAYCWKEGRPCALYDKCKEHLELDNGRIIKAGILITTITEIDYKNISMFYTWDRLEIIKAWTARKNYLPTCFIRPILKLYERKTKLKGLDGHDNKVNYQLSKELLNSASYGMNVTDIVHSKITYNPDIDEQHSMWSEEKPKDPVIISELLEKYKNGKNNFLLYQTGVYITAYARYDLLRCIKQICDNATDTLNDRPFDDVVYYDTDSIKMLHGERYQYIFDDFNRQVLEDMKKASKHHNLKFELFAPIDTNGKTQLLGIFDREKDYQQMKTLGAKRYFALSNGKYALTLAGVSKISGCEHILKMAQLFDSDPMDIFDNDLFFPAGKSGKKTLTYCENEFSEVVTDYQGHETLVHEKAFIHMENSEYKLSVADDYKLIINKFKGVIK